MAGPENYGREVLDAADEEYDELEALEHEGSLDFEPPSKDEINAMTWRDDFGNQEALGHDEESLRELRMAHGSKGYGASDIESQLRDDSGAHAMLSYGHEAMLEYVREGDADYRRLNLENLREALSDTREALERCSYETPEDLEAGVKDLVEAMTRNETKTMENTMANWSALAKDTDDVQACNAMQQQWDHLATLHKAELADALATAYESKATGGVPAWSEDFNELSREPALREQDTERLLAIQTSWYEKFTEVRATAEVGMQREAPEAANEVLRNMNYVLNDVIPEDRAAELALADARLSGFHAQAMRETEYHETASQLLDERMSVDEVVEQYTDLKWLGHEMARIQAGLEDGADTKEALETVVNEPGVEASNDAVATVYQEWVADAQGEMKEALQAALEASRERIESAVATQDHASLHQIIEETVEPAIKEIEARGHQLRASAIPGGVENFAASR